MSKRKRRKAEKTIETPKEEPFVISGKGWSEPEIETMHACGELIAPEPVETLATYKTKIQTLAKTAPNYDGNATAKDMAVFGTRYKAWLQGLRRATT